MATRFYYPAFRRHVGALNSFLKRNQRDLVALNNITDPHLTQINNLANACNAIMTDPSWPKYREQA